MMYFAIIFVSPLYFLVRGKWGGLILNTILYSMALLLAITIVLAPAGLIFWLLGVGHACWHLRKEMMEEHATMIATKMAEKMAATTSQSAGTAR